MQNKCRHERDPGRLVDNAAIRIMEAVENGERYVDHERVTSSVVWAQQHEVAGDREHNKWETSKEGVCAVYGCARSVGDSFVGWCESCLKHVCHDCLDRCSRVGCEINLHGLWAHPSLAVSRSAK